MSSGGCSQTICLLMCTGCHYEIPASPQAILNHVPGPEQIDRSHIQAVTHTSLVSSGATVSNPVSDTSQTRLKYILYIWVDPDYRASESVLSELIQRWVKVDCQCMVDSLMTQYASLHSRLTLT